MRYPFASLRTLGPLLLCIVPLTGCGDDEPTGPSTGSLEVSTSTTGDDIDPDGYTVSVDGGDERAIASEGAVTFDALEAGSHAVELTDVAGNCEVSGQNPRDATVTAGSTADLTFEVECVANVGAVEVSVATTGDDVDADGYEVIVAGEAAPAAADDTVVFADVAVGETTVELAAVASNCTVEDGDSRSVTVAFGDTATTAFAVTCAFRQIAFSSNRDGNSEVYIMNSDGTDLVNLTENAARDEWSSWSPDGSKIAFASDRDEAGEIYVMNADRTAVKRLTTAAGVDRLPAWSPDGTRIAFSTNRDDNQEIYVMDADGTNVIRLTNDAESDAAPTWRP